MVKEFCTQKFAISLVNMRDKTCEEGEWRGTGSSSLFIDSSCRRWDKFVHALLGCFSPIHEIWHIVWTSACTGKNKFRTKNSPWIRLFFRWSQFTWMERSPFFPWRMMIYFLPLFFDSAVVCDDFYISQKLWGKKAARQILWQGSGLLSCPPPTPPPPPRLLTRNKLRREIFKGCKEFFCTPRVVLRTLWHVQSNPCPHGALTVIFLKGLSHDIFRFLVFCTYMESRSLRNDGFLMFVSILCLYIELF